MAFIYIIAPIIIFFFAAWSCISYSELINEKNLYVWNKQKLNTLRLELKVLQDEALVLETCCNHTTEEYEELD